MKTYKYYAAVSSAEVMARVKPLRLPYNARGRKTFVKAAEFARPLIEAGLEKVHPDCRIVHWEVMKCAKTQFFCTAMLLPKNPIGFYGLSADLAAILIFIMRGHPHTARALVGQLCEAFRHVEP